MDSLRFDVSATIPAGAKPDDFPGMMQWLLLERFGLRAHTETKNVATFALVLAKGGPKMKPAKPVAAAVESNFGSDRIERVGRILESLWGGAAELGLKQIPTEGWNVHLEFTQMPMEALAQLLSSYLGAPVIDRTGLEGNYEATLEFSLADTLAGAQAGITSGDDSSASNPIGTSLFATVQKLGLKLEPHKAPIPVLVIDHLERVPTVN
jgi:uncharacterized protein (TIGR03435 family)